ncbi:MAG: putative regulatory protein [Bacteroidetes bacterium]|nr:putative regulatory protein [Bacteroidota bacterium]
MYNQLLILFKVASYYLINVKYVCVLFFKYLNLQHNSRCSILISFTVAKSSKTNVSRILDQLIIRHQLVSYAVDESDLSATHVAETLGENINQVFKTLVLKGNKTGFFVCVIPGAEELDLKLAAKYSGNKNCDMIPMKELLPTTGYIRGACSPIGMKKHFPTFIDKSCLDYGLIYVSAGQRGLQIEINPQDLIRAANAKVVDFFLEI